MKGNSLCLCALSLAISSFAVTPGRAFGSDVTTLNSATEVVASMADVPLHGIPPALLQDAQAVVIIPRMMKASLVLGGRYGRGVALTREPDGSWSYPLFVTFSGGSIGWQAGVQSSDLVLLFINRSSLDRLMKGVGKVTLGTDVSVAAGPVGKQTEAATDAQLKAHIYSYSHTRGLFAGASVEGGVLLADIRGNRALAGALMGWSMDTKNESILRAAERLRHELATLGATPSARP
jgi:lipid-binding SYLF domain-containing protein